jgi:hypothetical protein
MILTYFWGQEVTVVFLLKRIFIVRVYPITCLRRVLGVEGVVKGLELLV